MGTWVQKNADGPGMHAEGQSSWLAIQTGEIWWRYEQVHTPSGIRGLRPRPTLVHSQAHLPELVDLYKVPLVFILQGESQERCSHLVIRIPHTDHLATRLTLTMWPHASH